MVQTPIASRPRSNNSTFKVILIIRSPLSNAVGIRYWEKSWLDQRIVIIVQSKFEFVKPKNARELTSHTMIPSIHRWSIWKCTISYELDVAKESQYNSWNPSRCLANLSCCAVWAHSYKQIFEHKWSGAFAILAKLSGDPRFETRLSPKVPLRCP